MFIGSMMMATVVKALYPNWTWDLCMLLGTITSATDPVAVVALLRELGAKVRQRGRRVCVRAAACAREGSEAFVRESVEACVREGAEACARESGGVWA